MLGTMLLFRERFEIRASPFLAYQKFVVRSNDGLIGTWSYVVVGREFEAWRKLADFESLGDALLV